jgi:putative addiction module component (TIGR02574 family)
MSVKSKEVLKEVLELPAIERAEIVDEIISSLDTPDKSIEKTWKKEINARLKAYREGRAETVSAEEVLAKYKNA